MALRILGPSKIFFFDEKTVFEKVYLRRLTPLNVTSFGVGDGVVIVVDVMVGTSLE